MFYEHLKNEKKIGKMKTAKDYFEEGSMLHRSWDNHEQMLMNEGTFIELVEKIMPNQQWISVKDRLPTTPEEYITYGGQFVTVIEWDGEKWHSDFVEDRYFSQKSVTHWQPLPAKPF